MEIKKIVSIPMERCYATNFITINEQCKIIFASEAIGGECIVLNSPDSSEKETVWDDKGGTMAVVPIPKRQNEFLAIQNFFPGFNSKDAKVVWVRYTDNGYEIHDFIQLPYLHRFEILQSEGKLFFIGCTICTSKTEREDWSDPGKIYVGELPNSHHEKIKLEVLKDRLFKNHGFWKTKLLDNDLVYIGSQEGIFKIVPPMGKTSWSITHIFDEETSEMVFCDLDNDGIDELITISPFHGDSVNIFKNENNTYIKIWNYDKNIEFVHTLWAGKLFGKNTVIVGARKGDESLFLIHYNSKSGMYERTVIEKGVGPANIEVVSLVGMYYLASANHTKKEAAVYKIYE
jgi:hypothetical protein